jgi:nucleoside-diphosphate-sugar epimerase
MPKRRKIDGRGRFLYQRGNMWWFFQTRQAKHYVISSLAHQMALIEVGKAKPVLMVGNRQTRRDFLSVTDVVAAY